MRTKKNYPHFSKMRYYLTTFLLLVSTFSFSQNKLSKAWRKFDKQDYVAAIKICEELKLKNREFAEAYLLSGAAKVQLDELARSYEDLIMCLSLDPKMYLAYYYLSAIELKNNNLQQARELVHFFMENDSVNQQKGNIILIACLCAEDRLESAMHIVDSIEKTNQLNYQFLSWKGVIYEKQDSIEKAIEYYELSIKEKPNLIAYKNSALAHMKLGNYKRALNRFNKIPKQYDDHPEIIALKAQCLAQIKKKSKRHLKAVEQ